MNVMIVRMVVAGFLFVSLTQPAKAEWYEASSDHFVIYADDKDADIRRFSENLERYHSALAYLMKREVDLPSPSSRVTIYVVGGDKEMRSLSGSSMIGGFYIPRAGGSRAFVQDIRNKRGYPDESTVILLHEYAHHFLMSSSPFAMPRWLNEGAAEFFAASSFNDDGSLLVGRPAQHRAGDIAFADPVHVRELLDPELYEQKKVKGYDSFYAKAWLLYHYLTFNEARKGQLRDYQVNILDGMEQQTAADKAFGDLEKLERELKSYLRDRMYSFSLPPEKLRTGTITLRKLSAGEAAIMPLQIRSQRGVGKEEAATIVAEARAVASRFPEDPGVLTALAEAEYDAGHDAEAITAADAALAHNPASTNAYLQKGYALFRQAAEAENRTAAYAAAVKPFIALNKIENDHPLPLFYFFRAQVQRGLEPNENARAALERAATLAPFDQGLQINAGTMLIEEGSHSIARGFLAPVAANPHGGGASAQAKRLLALIANVADGEAVDIRNLPELAESPEVTASGD